MVCNQGCFDSIFAGTTVHCVLNPGAGREGELAEVRSSSQPKNIVVAGGGPAGMKIMNPGSFAFLMYHEAEDPEAAGRMLHTVRRKITVLEMMNRMAENVGRTWRWSLIKCLRNMGIDLRTRLVEITETAVIVETAEKQREAIPADTVIIAVGSRSVNELAAEAETAGIEAIVIGDAKKPRKLTDAIREGCEAGMRI